MIKYKIDLIHTLNYRRSNPKKKSETDMEVEIRLNHLSKN